VPYLSWFSFSVLSRASVGIDLVTYWIEATESDENYIDVIANLLL
jgi:hypothetical protein